MGCFLSLLRYTAQWGLNGLKLLHLAWEGAGSSKEAEQCAAFQERGRESEMKLFLHFYKKAVPVIVTDSL